MAFFNIFVIIPITPAKWHIRRQRKKAHTFLFMVIMLLHTEFLNNITEKYSNEKLIIHITDTKGQILASTDSKRPGTTSISARQLFSTAQPVKIKTLDKDADFPFSFGTPVYYKKELQGSVIVHSLEEKASGQGELIQASLESAMEYNEFFQNRKNEENKKADIARMLLEDSPNVDSLASLMNNQDIESDLLRTVICICLEFFNSTVQNTNWSMGYLSNIEQLRINVVEKLKSNCFLNSQDIVYIYDKNIIAVVKTFIPSSDPVRIYPALDSIIRDFEKTLEKYNAFSFAIAYGNLYRGITEQKKSLNEALEIIAVGKKRKPNVRCFFLENIMFDKICEQLDPQIINKMISPIIVKLSRKDGTVRDELIDSMEAFVDNRMNFSETAKNHAIHRNTIIARLERLKSLTGLDPAGSFQDAFLVKMVATYIRQQNSKA